MRNQNKYHRTWYLKNRERKLAQNKAWRDANKERLAELVKAWAVRNAELLKARHVVYEIENKSRRQEQHKEWYLKNKPRRQLSNTAWRLANKDTIAKKAKDYEAKNKERISRRRAAFRRTNAAEISRRIASQRRERRKSNTGYVMTCRLRGRLTIALKKAGAKKAAPTFELIGCDTACLRVHIESLFRDGMSWDNIGKWHLDHIIPCSAFDLVDPLQQKKCFHFSNLQPLWAEDNLSKGCKVS